MPASAWVMFFVGAIILWGGFFYSLILALKGKGFK